VNLLNTQKPKFLLLLPDGVGIRNFIITDFINQLAEIGSILVWHALPEALMQEYMAALSNEISWHSLPPHHEGHIAYINRRAKQLAQLYWQKEPGTNIILKYMTKQGHGLRGLRNNIADILARLSSQSYRQVARLNKMHAYAVERASYFSEYIDFLSHEKPDVVFCANQRLELAVPPILGARKLGIPTATFIYSWDNLPKGRMAVHADYFLVWSEHMKAEMLQYYPDINANNVYVTGTPQFEHYFNPNYIEPREKFLKQLGLKPDRSVICFSGDDFTTSPHDPDYLADLAEAVRKIPESERPQLLFRRSPTDVSGRYQSVLSRYPEIVSSEPAWSTMANNDWSKVVPAKSDVGLLVNVVTHCDLVVNVGSTMALDFAILHKPAIYLAYAPTSWKPGEFWSIEDVYRYPHFNQIQNFDPIYWAYTRESLPVLIQNALRHPGEKESLRQAWINFLVQKPLKDASSRCVEAIKHIALIRG